MATRDIPVRDDIANEIEKIARSQSRSVEEVTEEALDRYIKDKQWASLKTYGRAKARERGATEQDVDRAISEVRQSPGR